MNLVQIVAIIRLMIANKEEILELIELIRSLFAAETLIGDSPVDSVVVDDRASYPAVAKAVQAAGFEWSEFVQTLIENLDDVRALIAAIVDLIDAVRK